MACQSQRGLPLCPTNDHISSISASASPARSRSQATSAGFSVRSRAVFTDSSCGLTGFMGSGAILVIVEREISYAVHVHHGGEDTYYSPMTAASAGTPSVWTAWLWPAVSSRRPRHGGGTPGVTSSHASPRLGLGRHWLWVGLGWLPWAGGLGLVPTGRPQEAAAQEIEVGAAKHLAFHHFQPVDVPLDRAGTPGQGDAGFDRLIVLAEPARKALQGLERTGSRALQPGIEALRLALAHEVGKVLREVDRLRHRGMLLPELGELLRFGRGALGLTPQHQPC